MTLELDKKRNTTFDFRGWVYTVLVVQPGLVRVVAELNSGSLEVAVIAVGADGRPTEYTWASPFCADYGDRAEWRETMTMLIERLAVLTLREAKAVAHGEH